MLDRTLMLSESISIPFSISEAFAGFGTADGILHYEDEGLRLELEPKFLGFIDSGVKELVIPIDDLVSVEFKNGWISRSLTFQAKRLKSFEGVPGTSQGRLEVAIEKRDCHRAEHLATIMNAQLTTRQLNRIKDDLSSL